MNSIVLATVDSSEITRNVSDTALTDASSFGLDPEHHHAANTPVLADPIGRRERAAIRGVFNPI